MTDMTPGKKILLIDTIHPAFNTILEAHGFSITDGTNWTRDEVIDNAGVFNGLAIRSRFKLDAALLLKCIQLRFVARAGAGMENIDVPYADSKKIVCLNAPEGNRDAVGEHAIGMLLSLFNHLNRADSEVRKGIWKREENRGVELEGKTIGVIGYGHMGSSFVKKLAGFDVKILIYDKYKDFENGAYYRSAVMEELYQYCDVVSLHVPLTAETMYLIHDLEIEKYKKEIYLINTSRGKVVNTSDLVKHIKTGKIAGAALDVLEYESTSFENIDATKLPDAFQFLISSDKVILSPHIAGWTLESNYKIATTLAHKILTLYSITS